MALTVSKYEAQITPRLERAIKERLKLKRGERIWRVHVLVAKPTNKPSEE